MRRQHLWTKSILNGAVMGSQLVVQWSVWSSDRAVDWSHGLIPCDCFPPDSMRFLCVRIWLSCVPRSSPHQSPRQCLRQLRRLRHGNGSAEFAWNSCAIRAYAGCSNWEQLKVLGMNYIIYDFCSTFIFWYRLYLFCAKKFMDFEGCSQMFGMEEWYRKSSVAVQVWEQRGVGPIGSQCPPTFALGIGKEAFPFPRLIQSRRSAIQTWKDCLYRSRSFLPHAWHLRRTENLTPLGLWVTLCNQILGYPQK